ncbi:unnamed protein product [Schistosoma turkestanicum]|nr:unnamed protein product [Schistosoma turkestanicum]
MGVNVKSVVDDLVLNFRIDDQGDVLSIKFSEDTKILGVQRTHRSVDFINFQGNCPGGVQYSQECKNKSASLLGFVWCSNYEILFVTNEQLELYQVFPEKNTLRLNGCIPLNTCWFLWNSETSVCLTSDLENKLHIFQLKTPGTITKGPKFPCPTSIGANGDAVPVEQEHSFLTVLYEKLYLCTLRYVKLNNEQSLTRTVCFYTLKLEDPIALTHLLVLDSQGLVSFSVLDNLFMVHYQEQKVTSVFDIAVTGTFCNNVIHHAPVLHDISIAPFNIFTKIIPSLSASLDAQIPIDLYSMNWIIHLCGVVIDNSLGCSWLLCLNNSVFPKLIDNHNLIVDFLLHRSNGKSVLLEYCSKLVVDSIEEVTSNVDKPLNYKFDGCGLNQRLDQFAFVFKRICEVSYCRKKVTSKLQTSLDHKMSSTLELPCHCSTITISKGQRMGSPTFDIISQPEIYSHVFLKNQSVEKLGIRKLFHSILIEYIRVFLEHDICVDHCFYELLVNLVARMGNYTQLSFYIQSRLLADSKPTALQLLSLESEYPPAGQLAVDMLKRLNTCNSELFDALLIKGRPLEALRFAKLHHSENFIDMENVRNYLDVTQQIDDYMELYCTHHFLKESSSESYWNSDECRKYTEHFSDLFPST